MDRPIATDRPNETPKTMDSGIASEASPMASEIAPDMNSQTANPLRSDGGKPVSLMRNMYRRENTLQNTPDNAVEQPPPNAEHSAIEGPEIPRDRQAVLHLARMRLLSFDQLARLTYFSADKTVARRRLRR